jgi:hypothetical protein
MDRAAATAGDLSRRALHEGGTGNDRDSPERIEREEIGVTGDDQIGVAVDSQLKKFVVLRITSGSDSLGDRDQLGRRQQSTQPISKARRDQRRKARAGQSDEQLSLGDRRFEEEAALRHEMNGHSR